jgi:hypothetical protein
MSQSRQMGHLTKELSQAKKFRKSAVENMRRSAQATLKACATMRGEAVRDYRAQTHKFLASLAKDVATFRHGSAHKITQIRKNVATGSRAMSNQRQRWTTARHKAGDQMRGALERQVSFIADKVAALRSDFSNAHQSMAKHQKTALTAGRRKLRADMTRYVNAAHADRAKAQGIWSAFRLAGAA